MLHARGGHPLLRSASRQLRFRCLDGAGSNCAPRVRYPLSLNFATLILIKSNCIPLWPRDRRCLFEELQ